MKKNYIQSIDENNIIKDILENINSSIDIEEFNRYVHKYRKKYMPEDILIEREKRVFRQEELIEKYHSCLICMRINYPGIIKNNYISIGIAGVLCNVIINVFNNKILYRNFDINAEGPILTIVVDELEDSIKRKAINIEENHHLGRFVDIDVYNENKQGLSRKDFGMGSRKCYICDNYAQICVRNRSHSENEVKKFIKDKYEEYFETNVI
ncbi:citrate lyase holo-[acyl-carrier protein] synthase [Clostridiaceae bacterium UIB06]|uniref:citrate lyase holo-[acyl-carrier protein] synthase n=1 Tax=Clostridium thailandense TaxID=2794346 RepID=A0A949TPV1_9CLOT|nr:citrate lyase holo-[acyl-carrier protein] synthase [Clostridium thailandense]MBV7276759.1 citrate lyase holo-[acyl-carrier protein] synthase [Clostridium thailandense]MCH5136474.1 citrate lyase holo-[acyl-carrier protein] synthase [Clostridiaceae bacterium UIB06]